MINKNYYWKIKNSNYRQLGETYLWLISCVLTKLMYSRWVGFNPYVRELLKFIAHKKPVGGFFSWMELRYWLRYMPAREAAGNGLLMPVLSWNSYLTHKPEANGALILSRPTLSRHRCCNLWVFKTESTRKLSNVSSIRSLLGPHCSR